MNVGDKVQINLYDKDFIGAVLKIHKKNGWKGYIDVLLADKQKIILPVSYMKIIEEK